MTAPSVADRSDRSLSDVLLRSRLIHREARLRLVLAALRDRTREVDRDDTTRIPEPLLAAIADFEQELADVRERLHNGAPLSAARDWLPADEYAGSRQMEGQG